MTDRQIVQLKAEIEILKRTPIEFLGFYRYNQDLTQLTSSQLMGMLRGIIINLRQECYEANEGYEMVLGLEPSGKNEERNRINWTAIRREFREESK